jgi:hypothetical protein
MASFRFLFDVASDARIMQKAADPAGAFRFELSSTELVLLRDVVNDQAGVPSHEGLDVQVTMDADALDDAALARASAAAETTLIFLSASSRAPTADAQFRLAYEITEAAEDRAFLQYFPIRGMPGLGTPAGVPWLGGLWTAVHRAGETDHPLAQRVVLSMSWYRRALREAEELFRFNNLWLACEALNPRLCDEYAIPGNERKGLPGLRRLLQDVLGEDETFETAVQARNDLLHVNRVLPDELRARVRPIIGKLDDALIHGWRILLDISPDVAFPASSVRPYPYRHIVRGTLRPDDVGWSEDRHPYLEHEVSIEPLKPDSPGDIKYNLTPKWTLRNATQFNVGEMGLSGPETPNPFRVSETTDILVIRAKDQEPNVE